VALILKRKGKIAVPKGKALAHCLGRLDNRAVWSHVHLRCAYCFLRLPVDRVVVIWKTNERRFGPAGLAAFCYARCRGV